MKIKLNLFIGTFLILLIFYVGIASAYMTSTVQGINVNSATPNEFNQAICQPGQDFIIQIAPLGCTPAVVRTDLLEENDVPIFCQLSAIKINPLISVDSIDSISFSGTRSPEISGIGFHPAKAALGVKGNLNVPSLNNIGYIVINLKKQANASAIPDYVSGTLIAKVKYNINNAFGIGNALFYLPQLSDEDWTAKQSQYSFWNGKGILRADDITNTGASVSLYSNNNLISTVNLEKGKTSDSIYLPGFECAAGLKLKLEGLTNPDTRAEFRVNSEVVEVAKGEKFLDNKCQVTSLQSQGFVQKAGIQCKDDSGSKNFVLTISPQLILNIDGNDKGVLLGQWLYDSGDKSVYLGYIGTKKGSDNQDDLFIYLVSTPLSQNKKNLSANDIASINSLIKDLIGEGKKSTEIIDQTSDILKSLGGASSLLSRAIAKGQTFLQINFADKDKNFFGKQVSIIGFSGAQDSEISGDVSEQYENAKADYDAIIQGYSSEIYEGVTTYGEEALYNEIILAWTANQKKTALDLCKEFGEAYPNSNKKIVECDSVFKQANQETDSVYVTINKQSKKISFDGIYEPTFEDYGAKVIMTTSSGDTPFNLRKDSVEYLQNSGSDYIQLLSLDDNSATVSISVTLVGGTAKTQQVKLVKDVTNDFVAGYSFTLSEINLKQFAKVSLIPNIKDAGTETNFSFKIGIEKRAIQLPPEKVRETIDALNKTINQWNGISANLGNVVEGLKTACFATGAALVLKNLAMGTSGAGIARQKVMKGSNGWNEKCASMVAAGTYSSLDNCFIENADKIDGDTEKLGSVIDSQNTKIKNLEQEVTKQGLLTEQVVDTDKFMTSYSSQVNSYLANNNIDSALTDPSGNGEALNKDKILNILTPQGYTDRIYTTEQLREIELYANVLNDPSASKDLQDLAKQTLYSDLAKIQIANENYLQINSMATNLGIPASKVGWIDMGEKVRPVEYTGLTLGSIKKSINGYSDETLVYVSPASDGNKYLFILDNSVGVNMPIKSVDGVSQIYYYDTGKLVSSPPSVLKDMYFKKFDSSSYKNPYKKPLIKYYETEPYKGLPAIVPFDLTNGWYAATKPTIASGGSIASYDASARVTSFYLCNVGANGLEENIGGDDSCEMINTGTGQAYNKFPGLSESDAKLKINDAVKAIEQAKTIGSSSSGKVNILGNLISVGSPAVDTPSFQCQDFMSPKECLLIFNLCDPVICPSSRCDLGGAYPVQNVIQTGIIGSIALCLPNFQEGIVMPVCLTGIKEGIDGLLSVQNSYRDCLQESLNTGKMVGICDEVYSIYLCDFVWKQAIPFTGMIVPKLMELVAGQNVRGGGEYLGVSSAWSNAESSINYFTNYYGANSKAAFFTRTTEGIQSEVCKVYTSAVIPSGANFISSLTQPDSPTQFTGRFDEIPFSTVTVPPTSHYKVYYHIYAGKDSGASYQVYLKGSSTSTYYKDTQQNLMIASGYIAVGGYASDTPDKLATSGYKEMCINVNGQEECGFKEVSTDFAINYIKDQYLKSESTKSQITKTSECISGSANAYTLLNPNVQSGAESLIDPELYNRGIIRYCATDNPGKGTDPYAGTENSRYVEVGYCDDENMKCWLDTQTVEDTIKTTTVEGEALDEVSQNYVDILSQESDYLTTEQFSSKVQNITAEKDAGNRVSMINEIFEKVFFSNEKVQLLYLRGNAYMELFQILFGQQIVQETITETSTTTTTTTTTTTIMGNEDILSLNDARQRVLAAAQALDGTIVSGRNILSTGVDIKKPINTNCVTAAYWGVYLDVAGVGKTCIYSDQVGFRYAIKTSATLQKLIDEGRGAITNLQAYQSAKASAKETKTITLVSNKGPFIAQGSYCQTIPKSDKLDKLQPGDLIFYVWDYQYDHMAVFIKWIDKANGIAELFDWNGALHNNGWGISLGEKDKNGKVCTNADEYYNKEKRATSFCAIYRYYQVDISDDAHPVYVYQSPYISGQKITTAPKEETLVESKDPPKSIIDFFGFLTIKVHLTDNVYSETMKLQETKKYFAGEYVATLFKNLGINGLWPGVVPTVTDTSIYGMINNIKNNGGFMEVDVNNLKLGDVLLLGKGCGTLPYSMGIFEKYVSSGGNDKGTTSFFAVSGGGVENAEMIKEENKKTSDITLNVNDDIYIYKAYRYVGDYSDAEKAGVAVTRTAWTLYTAVNQVNTLTGDYTKNKKIIDEFIIDGIFTEQQCKDIRGGFLGFGQKDMTWIRGQINAASGTAH